MILTYARNVAQARIRKLPAIYCNTLGLKACRHLSLVGQPQEVGPLIDFMSLLIGILLTGPAGAGAS
jgi:hypothetical protein